MLYGSETDALVTDAQGSVLSRMTTTAGSAAVKGNQVYSPYGSKLYSSGSMATNRGYTGQYKDATGLNYDNARYYDSVAGCFISADTKQGNPQGMDPYAYVNGNPETLTDPTGHCDNYCITANVVMTSLEISDPVVGVAAETGVTIDIAHSIYVDGVIPSLNELEAARMKGDVVGMMASGVIDLALIALFIPPAAPYSIVAGAFFGTILTSNLGQIYDMIDTFWEYHPLISPNLTSIGTGTLELLLVAAEKVAQARRNNAEEMNRRKSAAIFAANAAYAAQHNRQTPSQSQPYPPGYYPLTSSWSNRGYDGVGYVVRSGDTLWGIANTFYGSGSRWQSIYQANRGTIGKNPNLIISGERLTI